MTKPVIKYVIFTNLKDSCTGTIRAASYTGNRISIKDFLGNITEDNPEGVVSDSSYNLEVNERSFEDVVNHLRHYFNSQFEEYDIELFIDGADVWAQAVFYELSKGNTKWVEPNKPCILTRVRLIFAGFSSTVNAVQILEIVREIDKHPADIFTVIEHYPSKS